MKTLQKPKPLRPGDTIAVIRPSSKLDEKKYRQSVQWIRELGFCVAEYGGRRKSDRYFAAADRDRSAEIHWAFSEPGIRLVIAARGGYGCQRALDGISEKNLELWGPRLFVGYSDITFMHQWIQNRFQWPTIHGPLAGYLSKRMLKKLLEELVALPSSGSVEKWTELRRFGTSKTAEGRLVGGNLSLLQTSGSASLPRERIILALEDVAENYYRLDRMIWNLIHAGYDRYVQAIVLGSLHLCGRDDATVFGRGKFYESLRRLCKGPILSSARFGHGFHEKAQLQRLLLLGLQAKVSGNKISYLEGMVQH